MTHDIILAISMLISLGFLGIAHACRERDREEGTRDQGTWFFQHCCSDYVQLTSAIEAIQEALFDLDSSLVAVGTREKREREIEIGEQHIPF